MTQFNHSLSQVSRQGEWLVFTEKFGLLTTQNGTQQVEKYVFCNILSLIITAFQEFENRVKLDYGDYQKLLDLGY